MACCSKKCASVALITIGSFLTVIGLVLALLWNSVYDNIFTRELVLNNHSQSFELWKETPIPMYFSVYLYNWTNSEEVFNSKWKVKPKFQECGPYVFSEHHIRVNVSWNTNNTVNYRQVRIWHFLPELSNGTLNNTITNVNPIVATIGLKLKDLPYAAKVVLSPLLKLIEKSLIVTKEVRELLFVGFEDPILKFLKKYKIPNLNIPFSKFGWFYGRNGSATVDGSYTMYTGKDDLKKLGILQLWNGENRTDSFEDACNDVKGTSGELWPPVKDDNRIFIFSSDICSTIGFDYIPSNQSLNGVPGKKFISSGFNFDNGTKYPGQACFKGEKVIPSGLRDISKCRFGAPAFVSYPHFYLADPIYLKSIEGLSPNKTKHESSFVLEPNTGIPLEVRAQLQLNFYIEPIDGIGLFANIKPTYIPMVWFRQTATLTKKYTSMASLLLTLATLGSFIGWAFFVVGVVLTTGGLYLLFSKIRRERYDSEPLLDDDESNKY